MILIERFARVSVNGRWCPRGQSQYRVVVSNLHSSWIITRVCFKLHSDKKGPFTHFTLLQKNREVVVLMFSEEGFGRTLQSRNVHAFITVYWERCSICSPSLSRVWRVIRLTIASSACASIANCMCTVLRILLHFRSDAWTRAKRTAYLFWKRCKLK